MLANAKHPSIGRSCNLLVKFSWTIHREINEELLFKIPLFGLRRFPASLLVNDNIEFPSPNAGADPIDVATLALPFTEVPPPSLLPATSEELRFS